MEVTSAFLRHYRSSGAPAARLERVLAIARAFLTVSGLIAIYIDPTEPSRLRGITYVVLLGYAIYSLAVLAWAQTSHRISARHSLVLHGCDVIWASVLTFVSAGPGSPFFLFFLFAVASSAYRWGFKETAATVVLTLTISLAETAVAAAGFWQPGLGIDLNRAVLRVSYLLVTGLLLGYLGEQEKESRAELAALTDLPRQPRVDLGLRDTVTALAEALMRTFDAHSIAVVLRDEALATTSLWCLPAIPVSTGPRASRLELNAAQQKEWLCPAPDRAWHGAITSSEDTVFRVVSPDAWPLSRRRGTLSRAVREHAAATVSGVSMGLPGEWHGRIYLFDIADSRDLERRIHFLDAVSSHIVPVLTNVFLLRRLRSQESAAERARVARELHDGAIQALLGIEMKLEALRRSTVRPPAPVQSELDDIQQLVHGEVLALRELIQALRPIALDANEKLGDVLVAVVERFRRDSGISARFVLNGDAPRLEPAPALELVRIVQEALVNVRKHSRAQNVLVRLTRNNGHHQLVVEDDGRGFEFEGRVSAAELDARRQGPAILKERARALGADLAVHSAPGVGARIELTFSGRAGA